MNVKSTADKAIEIANQRGGRVAIEYGLALACKGLGSDFKNKVRRELRRRAYRI
jgi:hypothetical protein